MSLRFKKTLVFVIAGLAYLAGQYFRGVWFLSTGIQSFCQPYLENGKTYCNSPYLNTLGWPLIMLGQMLALLALVLLFADARSFRRWLRFSRVYVPIAAVIIVLVFPVPMPLGLELSRVGAIRFFGVLYAAVAAGIILWSRFVRRPES